MIVLTGCKAAPFYYCLTTAQYCPLPGQYLAIARHETMRREIEKPCSLFYPSPFTFSLETPINTRVARGEGLAQPFTHPSPTLHLFSRKTVADHRLQIIHLEEGLVEFLDASHLIIGEPIRGLLIPKLIHHLCIELVIIDDRTVVYKLPVGNSKTEVTATSRWVAEWMLIVGSCQKRGVSSAVCLTLAEDRATIHLYLRKRLLQLALLGYGDVGKLINVHQKIMGERHF